MGKGLKEAALLMLERSDFETVIDWVIKGNKSALKDDLTAANARLFAEFKESGFQDYAIWLEAQLQKLKEFIEEDCECPICDGSGSYTTTGTEVLQDENGEPYQSPVPEQTQCMWCYKKDELLKKSK